MDHGGHRPGVRGRTGQHAGGKLPMNTNGGGLSYTHTGKYGMFAILESVQHLRGDDRDR
jgi:hypothetical protein